MRSILKMIIGKLVRNEIFWFILKPFATVGIYMYSVKDGGHSKYGNSFTKELRWLFNKREVLHGPFQGLKYPSLESVGSTIYPKLLGSYERELHSHIQLFCKNQYSEIVDIGCAEGYYAIGLSIKNLNAKVYAFDTDNKARKLCKEMAKLNNVENRLEVKGLCSAEQLRNFNFSDRGLVISDCEGFEISLFNVTNIKNLQNCDLIIESHDFIDINISTYLYTLFSQSHNIAIIKSIDDLEKAKIYSYSELDKFDLNEKKFIFAERRPAIMEWLICTPK